MASLSFGFKKTAEKKILSDSTLRDVSTKDDDTSLDFIKDVAGNKIIGTKKKEEKKELVIPLIKSNYWRSKEPTFKPGDEENEAPEDDGAKEAVEEEREELSLLQLAEREILEETKKELKNWEGRSDDKKPDGDIPAVMINQASEGDTNDDHLDVTLRAEQSTMDDYENVPIEEYGLAMLRGMGWKPGEGIGGYKKAVVAILDPQCRPKGLGLGATRPTQQEQGPTKDGEEELRLIKGAFVLIQGGKNRGLYGEVEGLDSDNARVMLKLGVGGGTVSVSENVIKLVTKQEFKENGKVVNLEKYDKYKEKERMQKEEEQVVKIVNEKRRKEKKHKRSRSRSSSPKVKKSKTVKNWVRPELRVRCVDKKSDYYKDKLVVVDVVTVDSCDCRTQKGKLVEGVRTDRLETIVPKSDLGRVMVVRGQKAGEIGEVINRDKSRYLATVQLIMSEEVLVLDYDSVCEYAGSVPEYE